MQVSTSFQRIQLLLANFLLTVIKYFMEEGLIFDRHLYGEGLILDRHLYGKGTYSGSQLVVVLNLPNAAAL